MSNKRPSIFVNNILQIPVGTKIYAGKDGNVIRLSFFDTETESHMELYRESAQRLFDQLKKELDRN